MDLSLNGYGDRALKNQLDKGFATPSSIVGQEGTEVMAKIMLIVTELSEAVEAIRDGDEENFAEELADVLIRTLGMSRGLGIDLDSEVIRKMTINEGRPYKHGRVKNI